MDLRELFIQNLKLYRKMRGISQMKLAELCDSSAGYIGQIEIGNKFPSIEMIDKISCALGIKPYLLFLDGHDEVNIPQPEGSTSPAKPEPDTDELILQLTNAVRRTVKRYYSAG